MEERFEERFKNSVLRWSVYCGEVDPVLEEYARRFRWTVEKWHEDSPARVVSWERGAKSHSISMLLGEGDDPKLWMWASTWEDYEEIGGRRAFELKSKELDTPVRAGWMRLALLGYRAEMYELNKHLPDLGDINHPTTVGLALLIAYVHKTEELLLTPPATNA